MMIKGSKIQVLDIKAVLSGQEERRNSKLAGEIELLTSRELAKNVIKKLGLLSLPEFNVDLRSKDENSLFNLASYFPESWKTALGLASDEQKNTEEHSKRIVVSATDIFLKKLDVRPVNLSKVVKISFESINPRIAALIANELPESYIVSQMDAKFLATERATKWLNEQLADLKDKVEASEKAVEIYREQHGLTEIKGQNVVNEQLSAINRQLILAQAERAQADARLRHIQKLMNENGSEVESATDVLASSLIQNLREEEAKVTRKASELSTEYGSKHPKILQVRAELNDIQKKISLEIQKIASGLSNEVEVLRIRERSLKKSLNELKKSSGLQGQESVQLRALVRESEANRTLLNTFLIRYKETSSTIGMEEPNARIISKAETPLKASFPKKRRMIILIVVGSIIISVMLIFIIHSLRPGLFSPEQIEKELDISAIGILPHLQTDEPHNYLLEKPHSIYGEALSSLKTSIMLSGPNEAVKAIQITSSVPEEGKSTLALSFSRLLAMSGKKVILVDADLHRASIESRLGIPVTNKGLSDLVASDGSDLAYFVVKDEKSSLVIMPKGVSEYVNAADMLSSHKMKVVIASLKKQFDYVIFDTPPVMVVSDARVLGRLVDTTVFVIHWNKTPVNVVKAALKQLMDDKVCIAGCILQQVNLKRYSSYSYGVSGYYYHYGKYGQYYAS